LAYIFGIISTLLLIKHFNKEKNFISKEALDDWLFWAVLGIIIGGRIGYTLFYNFGYYLNHPLQILAVWQGGMSFHGGFLGVVMAAYIYGRKHKLALLSLADIIAMAAPVGLLLGRMANFVNAELWGRPTDVPWGVIFPGDAAQACATALTDCARHPSQLYEGALEGLLLGTVLLVLVWRYSALKKPGLIAGLFFAGYGVSRFIVEFFREADAQFITPDSPTGAVFAGLSMGQLLCVPMIAIGLLFSIRALRK
jgi:phosphatidylglycerol:prolipoprotein diacylglycerol transferase